MPSFSGRRSELRARLADPKSELQPIEMVRIAGVLEDFLNIRDAGLTALTLIVADTGSDELARDYADKYSGFRGQANQKIGDMLSGLSEPSKGAVQFRERILVEEAGFWGAPGLAGLGDARDDLLKRAKILTDMAGALDKKWQALTEEDLRVEQAEENAATKVRDIMRDGVNQQVDLVKRAANLAGNILQAAGKIDDKVNDWVVDFAIGAGVPEEYARIIPTLSSIAQPAFDAAKALGISAADFAIILAPILLKDPGFAAVEWMKGLMGSDIRELLTVYSSFKKGLIYALQTPYTDQASLYRGLLPSHTALIVTFTGTRHDVDDFMKKYDTNTVQSRLNTVLGALDTWAGGASTDGQRSDAQIVRGVARDALTTRLTTVSNVFNALLDKYNGRFMGPLASETERQFINSDMWVVLKDSMVQVGLDDGVRDWRSTLVEIPPRLGDSFSAAERAFDRIPTEMRDRIRESVDSYLDEQLRALNSEAEDTARALESCQIAVNASKIGTDFDRSDLQSKLRG